MSPANHSRRARTGVPRLNGLVVATDPECTRRDDGDGVLAGGDPGVLALKRHGDVVAW